MVKKFTPIYPSTAGSPDDKLYYQQLRQRLGEEAGLEWVVVDKTDSSLTDIETRNHNDLQNIEGADDTDTDTDKDKHVSNAQMKAVADHIGSSNAHGATGNVVGDEDYATTTEYGVVKKAATQADATITTTETADATYSANEQSMLNNLKADVTDLQATVNALIDKLQTAGLME